MELHDLITKLLEGASDRQLRIIYQFLLSLLHK